MRTTKGTKPSHRPQYKTPGYSQPTKYIEGVRSTQRRFRSRYVENTFSAIQGTFRSIEMHSKRRYKFCICSVILLENSSLFENARASAHFTENFICNLTYYD